MSKLIEFSLIDALFADDFSDVYVVVLAKVHDQFKSRPFKSAKLLQHHFVVKAVSLQWLQSRPDVSVILRAELVREGAKTEVFAFGQGLENLIIEND